MAEQACADRLWYIFFLTGVSFPICAGSLLWIIRGCFVLWEKRRYREYLLCPELSFSKLGRPKWASRVKFACEEFVAPFSTSGKILSFAEFCAGVTVLVLYFIQVSRKSSIVETCSPWLHRSDWHTELVCNIFLLGVYIVRFIADANKMELLVSAYSIMTYFTVPASFLCFILDRNWIGFRCLRVCHLLDIPDFLRVTELAKSRSVLRVVHLSCVVTTILLIGGGIFHLLETTGDAWDSEYGSQLRSYWEYVYMCTITLSTIGYGDMAPQSTLGRLFCAFFIIGTLALFAASMPELYELVTRSTKYRGSYQPERGMHHVIVAGHITFNSMTMIINDFNRKHRWCRDLTIIFVHSEEPDSDMEAILRNCQVRTVYLLGSLLHLDGLRRARIHDATALLFVTNKNSVDPEREDSTAIMTAASVKNFNPYLRCVVQLLQTSSKAKMSSIPGFLTIRGDAVICFQEFELTLAAQNCMAPGCATLLSNLIRVPPAHCQIPPDSPDFMSDYVRGCCMEVHTSFFGPFFFGMTFFEVVGFCFAKLDLLLIGTFVPQPNNSRPGLVLCSAGINIDENCVAVFLAKSVQDVRRVVWYCEACHAGLQSSQLTGPCSCHTSTGWKAGKPDHLLYKNHPGAFHRPEIVETMLRRDPSRAPPGWEEQLMKRMKEDAALDCCGDHSETRGSSPLTSTCTDVPVYLDVSGNFYWSESAPFKSVMITRADALQRAFKNHIIVLVNANPDDARIGLVDLVIPMRSSRIPYAEVKEVVFLGDPRFLVHEWPKLRNLPKITVVDGDPLNRSDLRAISIKFCAMCVVLSTWTGYTADPALDDKAAVLATLNIRAMPFDRPSEGDSGDLRIPTITTLQHDINARLLDEFDLAETCIKNLYLTEPFMCAETVTISALDSLLVTSYFTPLAIPIYEDLLYGFYSPLMESFLAEGVGLIGGDLFTEEGISPYNTRIRLIEVDKGPWSMTAIEPKNWTYEMLFAEAVHFRMVCLGISRAFVSGSGRQKRVILTNPPKEFRLQLDDMVYVLTQ